MSHGSWGGRDRVEIVDGYVDGNPLEVGSPDDGRQGSRVRTRTDGRVCVHVTMYVSCTRRRGGMGRN